MKREQEKPCLIEEVKTQLSVNENKRMIIVRVFKRIKKAVGRRRYVERIFGRDTGQEKSTQKTKCGRNSTIAQPPGLAEKRRTNTLCTKFGNRPKATQQRHGFWKTTSWNFQRNARGLVGMMKRAIQRPVAKRLTTVSHKKTCSRVQTRGQGNE